MYWTEVCAVTAECGAVIASHLIGRSSFKPGQLGNKAELVSQCLGDGPGLGSTHGSFVLLRSLLSPAWERVQPTGHGPLADDNVVLIDQGGA